jgi:hypothetical protein
VNQEHHAVSFKVYFKVCFNVFFWNSSSAAGRKPLRPSSLMLLLIVLAWQMLPICCLAWEARLAVCVVQTCYRQLHFVLRAIAFKWVLLVAAAAAGQLHRALCTTALGSSLLSGMQVLPGLQCASRAAQRWNRALCMLHKYV